MRREGWETRLAAVIADAQDQPYVLGTHDCLRVALRTVEALTGVDRWAEFAGYTTKREALATIARFGSNFEAAISWFFGAEPVDVRMARRGDICLVETTDGEKHLGVCLGRDTALLAPDGLIYLATLHCKCAWRVA